MISTALGILLVRTVWLRIVRGDSDEGRSPVLFDDRVHSQQLAQTTIVNPRALEASVAAAKAARACRNQPGKYEDHRAARRHAGQYVTAGAQLVALVPDSRWVIANYKETQLKGLKPGQKVTFTVDALNGEAFTGHIESFSPASGSQFSVITPDNATGNFTKVAQRVPVRIEIDPGQTDADKLAPGLSVIARVDTSQS